MGFLKKFQKFLKKNTAKENFLGGVRVFSAKVAETKGFLF
jgi:hypothetical protein